MLKKREEEAQRPVILSTCSRNNVSLHVSVTVVILVSVLGRFLSYVKNFLPPKSSCLQV